LRVNVVSGSAHRNAYHLAPSGRRHTSRGAWSHPTIFVSYERDDATALEAVGAIEAALTAAGMRVLRDVDIEPGRPWSDELWRWLLECSGAVAVVTGGATRSDWCRREWAVLAARQSHAGLPLVPVAVDGTRAEILAHLQDLSWNPDAPAAVTAAFAGLDDLPPTVDDHLAAHLAWLRWQYGEAPALGRQPFTLADVYLRTECGVLTWREVREGSGIDPFAEEHGGRHDLIETVLDRFGDPDQREPIVVQGPAGSGKSAFTLRLADRLADEGLVPVVVRFRDLRLSAFDHVDDLLQDAVRVAPVGEHPPPPVDSLFGPEQLTRTRRFRDATMCRLVLILDGWDEVTLTGSRRFQNQIEELLPRVRERFADRPGPPVRLLLTGRPSAAVEGSGLLRRATPLLTIRPLRPDQLHTYAQILSNHLTGGDWRLDLDRWPDAFARYERWYDDRGQEPGIDVLGSPLLALLAFRTMAEWSHDAADLFAEPTALYHALIDVTVAFAGKAEPGPEGTVHRGGATLRRLLQRVAAAITAEDGESISFAELEGRLEDDGGALRAWAEEATGEGSLHELVVNFYFKSNPELGCEFLHKSFREYLHAEAIVAALLEAGESRTGPRPPPGREWGEDFRTDSAHHRASRALARLLAPAWLAPEVRTHLFWLIERAAQAEPDRWVSIRDLLVDVFEWWAHRSHLRLHAERRGGRTTWPAPLIIDQIEYERPRDDWRATGSRSTVSLDAQLGDALLQITAFVHWLLRDRDAMGTRARQSRHTGPVRFRPFDGDGPQLIGRIMAADDRPLGHGLACAWLRGCDLAKADLSGANLARADLRDADLCDASLDTADLAKARLARADLTSAWLIHANLGGADLREATLTTANLANADLAEADLAGSVLAGARLTDADLRNTDLSGTDLTRADLCRASLFQAELPSADLAKANLSGADTRRANLTGANLAAANAMETNLTGADLTGANLTDAVLVRANLTDVDLTNAEVARADLSLAVLLDVTLTGADLTDADLTGAVVEAVGADLTDEQRESARLVEQRTEPPVSPWR
jgi:uncharacterized protein YjbI with pentapeptide repeats